MPSVQDTYTAVYGAHSPLGGSGAARWIKCPGSVSLAGKMHDEGSDYAAEGNAAHALAERCLIFDRDAWQYIGKTVEGHVVDSDMSLAVQEYLDFMRKEAKDLPEQTLDEVELAFYAPQVHELMYGTADRCWIDNDRVLHVWDYKHGVGIVVDAKDNAQLKYYAVGLLSCFDLWDKVDRVETGIVQPRGFHPDGTIRRYSYSVTDLVQWMGETLVPAMNNAQVSRDTVTGDHCRFCPVRGRACPAMMEAMEELEGYVQQLDQDTAAELTADQMGEMLELFELAKIRAKAVQEAALARLLKDRPVPGFKLVNGRSVRVWKDGADKAMEKEFGSQGMEPAKMKSPSSLEKLPGGSKFTARWAFKPPAKKTIARVSDKRRSISSDTKSQFRKRTKGDSA